MKIKIELNESPNENELLILSNGLDQFTESHIGFDNRKALTFFIRDEQGIILGGITGSYGSYGWLWIDTLWVSDKVRGKNFGTSLVESIEQEALKGGCKNVYLNTFSFSAVDFYKKLGYTIYAQLDEFPEGHSVYSLRKKLI